VRSLKKILKIKIKSNFSFKHLKKLKLYIYFGKVLLFYFYIATLLLIISCVVLIFLNGSIPPLPYPSGRVGCGAGCGAKKGSRASALPFGGAGSH